MVKDIKERSKAIQLMAKKCKEQLSENFLAAHGFDREMGWSALSPNKPIVIVKLKEIRDILDLKSPYWAHTENKDGPIRSEQLHNKHHQSKNLH